MKSSLWPPSFVLFLPLICAFALLTGCSKTAAPVPAKITAQTNQAVQIQIGYLAGLTNTPLTTAQARGYLNQRGVDIQLIPFSSSPQIVEALAEGKIQIGGSIECPAAFALENRQPGKFKIIMADTTPVPDGNYLPVTLANSGRNAAETTLTPPTRLWLFSVQLASRHPKKTRQLIRTLYDAIGIFNRASASRTHPAGENPEMIPSMITFQKISEIDPSLLSRQEAVLLKTGVISNQVDPVSFLAPLTWVNGTNDSSVHKK